MVPQPYNLKGKVPQAVDKLHRVRCDIVDHIKQDLDYIAHTGGIY